MADFPADPTDRLHQFASGFHATFYVYSGVASGLFRALREPRTTAELADSEDLHEPYVRQFCETGLRWELLSVSTSEDATAEPTFRVAEEFVDALATPEATEYMGDLFRYLGGHQSADYAGYPTAFETGERRRTENKSPEFTEAISGSTAGLHDVFVDHLLPDLDAFAARLEEGGRLVDVGCGTGRLLCRLARRFPTVETVGYDLDEDAVRLARERADRTGVADRTSFRARDAADLDGPVTAAVFFLSLHEIGTEKRQALFERLGNVLADDGVVVVFDEAYPDKYDQFTGPPYSAGVETQWAELTWGADVPTPTEHRDLLAAAGCTKRVTRIVADRFLTYEGVSR